MFVYARGEGIDGLKQLNRLKERRGKNEREREKMRGGKKRERNGNRLTYANGSSHNIQPFKLKSALLNGSDMIPVALM